MGQIFELYNIKLLKYNASVWYSHNKIETKSTMLIIPIQLLIQIT